MCTTVFNLKILVFIFIELCLAPRFGISQFSGTESEIMDASDITWAHAVNSRKDLEEQLSGPVDFLEADISVGHINGNLVGPAIPIMAHPPDTLSDISFESWLDTVIARSTRKGIKLDFKSLDTVDSSLKILQKHGKKIHFPLWLNADILPGPVDSLTLPVNASEFLKLTNLYFPNSTLSVGWTTTWYHVIPPDTWRYSWYHVKSMADTLQCSNIEPNGGTKLTFPVRAIFLVQSISKLRWLLEVFPNSTLTVWSGKLDTINLDDLLKIRKAFNISRVYYDIPEPLGTEFRKVKDTVPKYIESDVAINKWWTMSRQNPKPLQCFSTVYSTSDSLFFSKGQESATLFKDTFDISKGSHFKAQGIIKFVETKEIGKPSFPSIANNELVLALADISLFKKDAMPFTGNTDDTAIVWETLNSSPLYEFQRDVTYDTAYFFKLDTSKGEDMFQVWKLNRDMMLDDPPNEEDMIKKGTPLIDKNKRLVLPPGPIMVGFISDGRENIIVYDLSIQGVVASQPRTSSTAKPVPTIAFATFLVFITFIFLF